MDAVPLVELGNTAEQVVAWVLRSLTSTQEFFHVHLDRKAA